ncbi:MAG: insulinase family protein [Calditrichaeota bacterium]|nr:insulinase family protein [Calditrichota bacterium]
MKFFYNSLKSLMILFLYASVLLARETLIQTVTENADTVLLQQVLPLDRHLVRDTLGNGIVYYIRKNIKPENRAEIRLAINAGSILEKEEQQGLAHFLEHMAFNGTRHFEKNELVNYLESIGMRFGPDINAYTSFDETVYMLHVPTDSAEILREAFLVLQDWASAMTLDPEEVKRERGVVIEEWRLRRGADSRIMDKQLPILFKGSRYAERMPIGKLAVLDTFHLGTLKEFYRDWYRPSLQAVIAVGDFEVDSIRALIQLHFGGLNSPKNAPERKVYSVPPHDSTFIGITSDPEAQYSQIGIYYKFNPEPEVTINDYRKGLIELLYNRMFNQRLSELAKKPDPPFLFANSGKGRIVRTSETYILNAVTRDNRIPDGLNQLLLEAKRVKMHGFTPTELERAKKSAIRMMEQAYRERENTESQSFADEYVRNYLMQEPIPGIEYELKLFEELMPGISLDEVNRMADEWIVEKNRVLLASYPEKPGMDSVDADTLRKILVKVDRQEVEPYVDDVAEGPLFSGLPQAGSVIEETVIAELGVTEWILNNGIRVVLKPTDFMSDEIVFTSYSPGGYSLVPDSLLVQARTAASVVNQSGVADFTQDQLKKKLAGKVVRVSPYIGELTEGLSGNSSTEDVEALFQLIYLYFTQPRADSAAFQAMKQRFKSFYENRVASPEAAFRDTITVTLTQDHPRYDPWTVQTVEKMNMYQSLDIYKERFADAGDFTFIFVGNFRPEIIKPFVEKYLGGLPSLPRQEGWRDVTYDFPEGIIRKTVNKGVEPKSLTSIILLGEFSWSLENKFLADALMDVIRIKFRERVREDLGGTYGVRVNGDFSQYPRERYQINISFGADPDKIMDLSQEIFTIMDSLKKEGIEESYIRKVREIWLREHQTSLKENDFWLDALETRYFSKMDPRSILKIEKMIRDLKIEDVQKAALKYLDLNHYVQVTLFPENK